MYFRMKGVWPRARLQALQHTCWFIGYGLLGDFGLLTIQELVLQFLSSGI